MPCGLIGYAYASTAIAAWAPGQGYNNQLKANLAAAGGKFGSFVWMLGHSDAVASTSASAWTAAYNALVADLAGSFPGAAFGRVITTIPSLTAPGYAPPQAILAIRAAAEAAAAAAPGSTAHVEPLDAPINAVDNVHPSQSGMAVLAIAHYSAIARLLGLSAAGPAPAITGAVRAAGSAVVRLTLSNSGTALLARANAWFGTSATPTAAALASQFMVYASPLAYSAGVPQGAVAVSGAAIVDATHVDLTLASALGDAAALDVVLRMPVDAGSVVVAVGIYDD